MRLPYLRILFEIACLTIIVSVGICIGYTTSRYAIHYLVKDILFLDKIFVSNIVNEHGYYEMTPPTIGDNQ